MTTRSKRLDARRAGDPPKPVGVSHGGWDGWETFREHYLGEFSPKALRRERNKISWLFGSDEQVEDAGHAVTVSPPAAT